MNITGEGKEEASGRRKGFIFIFAIFLWIDSLIWNG